MSNGMSKVRGWVGVRAGEDEEEKREEKGEGRGKWKEKIREKADR